MPGSDEQDQGEAMAASLFEAAAAQSADRNEQAFAEIDARSNRDACDDYYAIAKARELMIEERARTKAVVTKELNNFTAAIASVGMAVFLGYTYGTWAFAGAMALPCFVAWDIARREKLSPDYRAEEIDRLAKDTITHLRIVELENSGRPWVEFTDEGPREVNICDYPYWSEVNRKVRQYRHMSHPQRLAEANAAEAASRPYRKAKGEQVHSRYGEWPVAGLWKVYEEDEADA